MKTVRMALSALTIGLLGLGFIASQLAGLSGNQMKYAEQVDAAPIRMLALVLLLGAVALAFVPEREESET